MRGDWLKIWIARQPRCTPRSIAFGRPPAGETCAPISIACGAGRLRLACGASYEGSLRAISHRGPAHRRCAHGPVQLAARPPQRRRDGAAHRGHRPRALDAGERRADHRRVAVAGARLGRGPDPADGATVVHDVIRGDTRFEHVHLDDPVIARADGSVLYNFAVAIDDLDAAITHVVRGEDHLSNTPKQMLVLEAARAAGFGPDTPLPTYAHLPLLHGPDGKKLSKRHGAASVQELRDAGYLPEAVRNYLALLGWGAGDDQTVLSTQELIERFTLERVSRNPARFDEVKLRWLNGVYIRKMPVAELTQRLEQFTGQQGLEDLARISQEKIHTLADFWPLAGALREGPVDDPKARERWLTDDGRAALA